MKIQNLFFGDNNIRKAEDSRSSGKTAEKKAVSTDSTSVSGADYVREQAGKSSYTVEPEAAPRMELVNQVKEHIQGGAFDTEYLFKVAESVAESPVVKDVIEESEMAAQNGDIENSDRVEQTRSQIASGYYDNPVVLEQVAESLINALGLDFMTSE